MKVTVVFWFLLCAVKLIKNPPCIHSVMQMKSCLMNKKKNRPLQSNAACGFSLFKWFTVSCKEHYRSDEVTSHVDLGEHRVFWTSGVIIKL